MSKWLVMKSTEIIYSTKLVSSSRSRAENSTPSWTGLSGRWRCSSVLLPKLKS